MYCPKCSQEQVSDEMRFCSRCGFPLSAVRELVESGSAPPIDPGAAQLARKQKVIRRGAWMMLATLGLTIFVGLLTSIDDDFVVLMFFPALCFVIGFLQVLYGVFLSDRRAARRLKQAQPVVPAQLNTPPARAELSAPRVAPAESFSGHRVETAEMVRPASVTENTTRLLDDESDPRRR